MDNAQLQSSLLWDEYRRFHESAPIGYLTLKPDSSIVDVNAAGARLLGASPQRLLGRTLSDFVAGPAEGCESLMHGILQGEGWYECELEMKRIDHSRFYALLQGRQITGTGELVVFVTDVTETALARNALLESERKYRELADRLAEGVFEADLTGAVTYANQRIMSALGLSESDLKNGLRVFDVIAPQSLDVSVERFARVLRGEDIGVGEYVLKRKNGSQFPALVHSLAVVREGAVIGVRGLVVDISEQKRVEVALRESEQKYRELADLLGAGVFETDPQGNLTYANRKGLLSFGFDENDFKEGINVFSVILPQERKTAGENFARVLKQEDIGPVEYTMVKKDGTIFPGLTYSSSIVKDGEAVGVRGVALDISERKRAENALRESEQKYRELTDLLDEGVYEIDPAGRFTYANRRGLSYLGYDQDDLKHGLSVFDIISTEDSHLAREKLERTMNGGDTGAAEFMIVRKDGTSFPALTHGSAIVRNGVVVGIRGIVFDISDLKRAELALKESERKYRELADLLDEAIFEVDVGGNVTYANRKGMAYLGMGAADIEKGLNAFDMIAPEDLPILRERISRIFQREDVGSFEYRVVRRDGTTFPALTHSSAIVEGDKVVGLRAVLFDISDFKRTEQALRDSEERFRTLIKSLHEGIWVLDKDDLTAFVNPRMAEILGYPEDEIIGKPVVAFTAEEWQKFTLDSLERRRKGVTEQLEGQLLRKDGARVYVLLEASPILDADGNFAGSIAGVQDITERKLAEERLKRTLAELDRSNKELEQFAYVTSHDLREPLRMMTSFAQSLEKRYKDKLDKTADEYIHFIVDGAARMQRLIDDILIYSRVTTRGQPFEPVDMEKALQEVLLNLKAAADETGARITHDPLPVIRADPTQMKQVLQNLIGNALKFRRSGVPPAVHLHAVQKDGDWVFSVKDNGIGIDPELFGRLFTLFQRLHPPDKYPGTGVGLAVSKKIVQRHGGRIWVESQPGEGSTFRFTVPVTPAREHDV